ncbi:MAG TPA: HlyD family secretion protein [Steroidobacteraceae bacterium]|nr:HlyD family secretion protein [Steroidobacteraceae bacterium]
MKTLLIVVSSVALIAAVAVFYVRDIAPYESTDDAFIDGYVTVVSPRVAGQVLRLLVNDNEQVKQGQVLVQIDPRDYRTRLAQARADLAAAQSQLQQARAQVLVSVAKVAQSQASVISAAAQALRSGDDLQRYQAVESRAVSKTALEQAQVQARSTSAALNAARSAVRGAQAQVQLNEAGVATAMAAIQQAQARAQQAELDLSYTQVIAPVDGRVTARSVQPGNYIEPGQALLALVPRSVWVVANFKETQLTDLRPGQPVELQIDAYPGMSFKAHVDSLQAGTGGRFSLLPPENAVGNYVKVVQRVPVKIDFNEPVPQGLDVAPGMSVEPRVRVK